MRTRPTLFLLLLLVAAFATVAGHAAPVAPAATSAQPDSPTLFLDDSACAAAAADAAIDALPDLDPTAGAQQKGLCGASFCSSDSQCRANCPSDPDAYCSGFQCVYPNQGGGGGGGGGGGSCNAFCQTTAQ